MVSVAGLILNNGLVSFIFSGLRDDAIFRRYGHIQIYREGYRNHHREAPFSFLVSESDYHTAKTELLRRHEVARVTAEMTLPILLQSSGISASGVALGFETESNVQQSLRANLKIISGSFDFNEDAPVPPVWLGKGLAERLQANTGQIISIMSSSQDQGYGAIDVQVRGIFEEGFRDFDDWSLRIPISVLQHLCGHDGMERILVFLHNTDDTDKILSSLKGSAFASSHRFEISSWYDLAEFYRQVVAMFGKELNLIRFIIEAVAFCGIASSLAMAFTERRQEMAVLLAMGMTKSKLALMFGEESFFLGCLGSFFGALLGIGLAVILSIFGIPMPPPPGSTVPFTARIELHPVPIGESCLLTLIVAALAAIFPALWIWKLNIAAALRQEEG